MVDLKAKPFYLNDEQIRWVEDAIAGMTLDEKLGQLFVILQAQPGFGEKQVEDLLDKSHMGGLRWQNGGNKQQIYDQLTAFQKHSKLPLLIAANCDDGGSGAAPEGTFVATAAECGAGEGTGNAYHVGLVAGREASALGANWMFNPVVDVYKNWRNTIVNTRSFGSDPDKVIANARAYIRGVKDANPNMACTAKHFPGDGVEELDQHLAMGVNSLSVEDWEATFGRVYRTLITDGLEAVMVGHIALPEMSRKLCPGIADKDIKPATLAPELLTGLLRGDMGFNGVIITDATHMVGFSAVEKRRDSVPDAIIAGCDMILFANDVEEDVSFLRATRCTASWASRRTCICMRSVSASPTPPALTALAAKNTRRTAPPRPTAASPWSRTPAATCPSTPKRKSGCSWSMWAAPPPPRATRATPPSR